MLNVWLTSCAKAKVIAVLLFPKISCEEANTDNLFASHTPDVSFITASHLRISAVSEATAHQDE